MRIDEQKSGNFLRVYVHFHYKCILSDDAFKVRLLLITRDNEWIQISISILAHRLLCVYIISKFWRHSWTRNTNFALNWISKSRHSPLFNPSLIHCVQSLRRERKKNRTHSTTTNSKHIIESIHEKERGDWTKKVKMKMQ